MNPIVRQMTAACFVVSLALPGSVAAQSQAQSEAPKEVVKASHGDWDVVCASAGSERCVIRQVGKTADGRKALEVRIRNLEGVKTKDGEIVPAMAQIMTPLGTIIPLGVKVEVDQSEARTAVIDVCLPQGCVAEEPLSDQFLGLLKAGATAKMTFALVREGETPVDLSLNGFTKAFGSL